ncbi:MAG: peptidylprolyl isomerase [Candidatus Harrisonbacteria bacterium]|nr:peptidylprolyl isomerase [Candidatus Harrisonbacteria bacterium]MBI2406455.1 peptidylprolyl isomerase [Candidatus Harrisonbacteria bacterium]
MITLETSAGNIALEFYTNDAPKTVANFLKLAKSGYYDGLSFHRVIPGFMIQGGDPNCGKNGGADAGFCGGGGPGYQFEDELNPATASYKTGYKKGVLAMANAGPNTNGSQFFILVADYPLPHNYTIFGRVTAGQDVADAISNLKRNANDRPFAPVVMKRVVAAQ